ncbi:hypothetical protein G9274_002519 [Stenotrophomonas rhizophila]|nr:hypothetical protein G9274_002519 [Stenotrophomonas rhizophila]
MPAPITCQGCSDDGDGGEGRVMVVEGAGGGSPILGDIAPAVFR